MHRLRAQLMSSVRRAVCARRWLIAIGRIVATRLGATRNLDVNQSAASGSFLFLLPLPTIFLPNLPIPFALPLPILAAPFPVPTPTSLAAPPAPLPRSAPALPGCNVTRLPAPSAVPLPRLTAPLPAPFPMSSPPFPISLPELGSTFCFPPFCRDCVWDVC